jgi:hypothetical protein
MVNYGILGSGDVAKSFGAGLVAKGHTVMLGTRDPQKLEDWKKSVGDRAHVGSFEEAAKFGVHTSVARILLTTDSVGADLSRNLVDWNRKCDSISRSR